MTMRAIAPFSLSILVSFVGSVSAQPAPAPGIPAGTVLFPNSCSQAAQQPFELGLTALHNFEYTESAELFVQARTADPQCAIAGWGEAMTYWHAIWGRPDAKAFAAGKRAAVEAQAHQTKATPREREYIAAIAAYYLAPEQQKGADAYTARMKALHAAYPADNQATLFYALALIATENGDHASRLAQARRAGALIEPIFEAEPWNPGAAHYLIHAYDEPELAPAALKAARAYAKIAPDAPHALHMPAHIFAQLGLWHEDIDSNQASYRAARAAANQTPERVQEELHSLDYLQNAQLQLGDVPAAKQTTALALRIAESHPEAHAQYTRYGVAWRVPVETDDWESVAAIPRPAPSADKFWQAEYAWLQTLAAGKLRQKSRAAEWLRSYKLAQQAAKLSPAADEDDTIMLLVMEEEAEGWEAIARGDEKAAITHMQLAVKAEQDPLSGIYARKPAEEMLADLDLALGHKAEAAAAYRATLEQHHHRRLSELGLKQAEIRAEANALR